MVKFCVELFEFIFHRLEVSQSGASPRVDRAKPVLQKAPAVAQLGVERRVKRVGAVERRRNRPQRRGGKVFVLCDELRKALEVSLLDVHVGLHHLDDLVEVARFLLEDAQEVVVSSNEGVLEAV